MAKRKKSARRVRDVEMAREERKKGFFVAFDYSSDAMEEVSGCFKRTGRIIIPLTVRGILEEDIARKLA